MVTLENERFFSLELKNRSDLKNIALSNGTLEGVLVEGCIGELVEAAFVEDAIFEVLGSRGTFRINLTQKELKQPEVTENGAV